VTAGGDGVIAMRLERGPLAVERNAVPPPSFQDAAQAAAGVLFARELVVTPGEVVQHERADPIERRLRVVLRALLRQHGVDHRGHRVSGARGGGLLVQHDRIETAIDVVVEKLQARSIREVAHVVRIGSDVGDERLTDTGNFDRPTGNGFGHGNPLFLVY